MKDITTRADLELLMDDFYRRLLNDSTISYIFTDIAKIDLVHHLSVITDFWEQNILGTGYYRRNVLQVHLDLDAKEQLLPKHFDTWLSYFNATVDDHFAGEKAEMIKTRALSVATVMQIKLAVR